MSDDLQALSHRASYVDMIARIHAGFHAERALAASLDGRTVAVRGVTGDELSDLSRTLEACGAEVVRVLVPDVAALVTGSRTSPEDLVAATNRGLAVLRSEDVKVIATVCERVRRRDERMFQETVGRALANARRAVGERDLRIATPAEMPAEPVRTGTRVHVRR